MRKRILTFALVAVMALGSTMTAFAANSPDANKSPDAGNVEDEKDDDKDNQLGDDVITESEAADIINKADTADGGIVSADEVKVILQAAKLEGTTEKLVVSVVTKDSADYKVVEAATKAELKDTKFTVIDLKFESKKQPTADTKITFPVAKLAEIKNAKFVSVYAIKDAKMELVDVVEVDKDGNFSFVPKHFSTYVFAEATQEQFEAAKTGDTAPVALMMTLAAVAAAGCAVVSMKKKEA